VVYQPSPNENGKLGEHIGNFLHNEAERPTEAPEAVDARMAMGKQLESTGG